ncbi:endonuclease/exonuclease/phosphatase family protein [Aurantimonas marianensis]|uniref:Endonuclease/exonuclease/phosphatase family protein n=1 Tax=Aurantimonas marianensis TaxID=2920428 RepID=A0A9X2H5F4_9HYPH|nr:endonuclease/exonuclease/phosphatase family protein [Aurantimonas marianensis]MCP3055642.1 endonuclease/exonuclease/phosphatase family protein [Aurantimonas marianensis]
MADTQCDEVTMRIRVASYNIRKAIGRDARRNPERILDLVASLDADIVALQEADYRFNQRRAIFDAVKIHERTGLRLAALDHDEPGLGWHGNVVLIGDRIDVRQTRCLELPGLEPRGAVLADLTAGDRPLRMIATHLGLLARYRYRQSQALLAAAELNAERATIIVGDFNGWGRTPNSLSLFEQEMSLTPTGPSYPSRRPLTALDRIYHNDRLALTDCAVLANGLARVASDHLPIWAEFEFGGDRNPLSTGKMALGPEMSGIGGEGP